MTRFRSLSRIFLLVLVAASVQAQVTSTFDANADGWSALNASAGDPQWLASGGSAGGGISLRDNVPATQGAFFLAPSKFLGNQINSYGEELTFDLWVGAPASANAADGDVQLIGSGSSLFLNLPFLPPSTFVWTTYSIRLDETANWKVGSIGGAVATAGEVRAVLSSLTAIRINGEYASAPGSTARLDGVILNQIAPVINSFTPEEGPVGATVVITGIGFNPTPALNTVRFNGVTATVSASSSTSLTVVVPTGATSGRIEVTVGAQSVLSSSVFCVPATPPSTFGLVAYFPFSGNALDASGNANNGTVTGAVLTTDPFGTANNAYRFNGSSSFIQVPNSGTIAPVGNELTLSAWVNFQSQPFGPILSKSTGTPPGMYSFGVNANDRIYVQVNSVSNRIEIPFTFCPTQWYQITAVLEPTAAFVYVDGTLVGSQSFTTNILFNSEDLQIGRQGTEFLNGSLDEVRIYNRALSACEVAAIFTPADDPVITSITPPSAQVGVTVTILGTGFAPVAANNVVRFNGVNATVLAATTTTLNVRVPFGATTGPVQVQVGCNSSISSTPFTVIPFLPSGNVVTMSGTTDWIEVPDDTPLRASSLTVEAWVNIPSPSGNYTFISKAWNQPSSDNSYKLAYANGFLQGEINYNPIFYSWSPTPNEWNHIALTFDESTSEQVLYVNGVAVGTSSLVSIEYDDGALAIGADIESGVASDFFAGKMEEVRIWNIARSQSEIQSTLLDPLSGVELGLVAYYNMDESGAGENLIVNNNSLFGSSLNGTTRGTRCTPVFSLGPPPNLVSFSPTSGSVGTTVALSGSGFSTVRTENEVFFNGRSATVISATGNELVARVPPGATSGPVTVRVNCAETVFPTNFTVVPFTCPPGSPTGGNLDISFDADVEAERVFRAIELQSSGKAIVSVGVDVPINGTTYEGLLRFNSDGSLDNTFASSVNYYPERSQLVVLPNDKILVVETGTESYVRRLNADGTLDNGFTAPIYYGSTIHSLGYQQDEKVLVSVLDGTVFPSENFIYRLEEDGTPDAAFVPFAGFRANVIWELPAGKILLGGEGGLVLLNGDGTPDPSFSVLVDGTVNDFSVLPDGKIVIVGAFNLIDGHPVNNVARLNPDGSVDETFASGNGLLALTEVPNAIQQLPAGGFAIAGRFSSFNNVARSRIVVLNENGSLRCAFDPAAGPDAEVRDLEVQADEKILIVGAFIEYNGVAKNAIVRINNAPASCVPTSERNALIALYNATNGPSWSFRDNWLSADESQWLGVGVTGCRVTTISIQNNNLNGTLPPELGDLTQLRELFIAGHPNLTGSIPPSFGTLANLERLSLWQNQLSGSIPPSLGNLSNLRVLELMINQLSGPIPPELANLAQLDSLRLDGNQLTGTIPASLYTMTSLEQLDLTANQLTGTLSPQLANLTSLRLLGLSNNQFTGSIPDELGTMLTLRRLGLANNSLTGPLPASLGNLVNLVGFTVFNNQLSGPVPASLGNLVNLTGLGLSVNQFTGDLPATIGLIPGLTDVSVRDNDFTSIPTFVSNSFTDLRVFGNKLHFGHLEPNIGKGGFVYSPQDNLPGGSVSVCEGTTLTINFSTPGTANQYQWFKDGVLIPGATGANFTKASAVAADAGSYSVQITNTIVPGLTLSSDPFVVTVSPAPIAPTAGGVSTCSGTTATLTASGGTAGQYRWYTTATGGTALAGETNATYTTPTLTATTDYFVAINDGSCESTRTTVTVTVNALPTAPTAAAVSTCSGSTATLTASGGTSGQYRWYTTATGGTALPGETNPTYTTPALTANTNYFVSINNGSCESTRTAVTVAVNSLPAKPTVTASGPLAICANQSVILTAPAGFTYQWSTGATTAQITVTTAGSYTVIVRNANGCSSVPSDPVLVTIISCAVNQPPVISGTTVNTVINGIATIRLTDIISDPDNNLNLASLRIVTPPLSGAQASIDANFSLVLNYANVRFAGRDEVVIEVCDQAGLCVQQRIFIEVAGDIVVFNGVSPNGDGFNNTWVIQNIETLPDTRENKVTIFNRWGDLIWEGVNYDNQSVVFTGLNKNGNEVASGTYFYKIEFPNGRETKTGFLTLRR